MVELRAAPRKLAFTLLAVGLGTGMLSGVRGLSESFLKALLIHAREWMAADAQIRLSAEPTSEQLRFLKELGRRGVRHTAVLGTLATVAPEFEPGFDTVAVKVVDPAEYPYYGEFQADPPRPLSSLLAADTLVCSPELLEHFHIQPGETLVLGGAPFRIAGVIRFEPDRFAVTPVALNRVILNTEGMERTRLMRFGNRGVFRLLLKLPGSLDPSALRPELERIFPEGEVTDYRQNDPDVTDIVEKVTAYLSLVSSIGLIVGSLGVAMSLYSHIEQRLEMIAVMKTLGGRSTQILTVFGVQAGLVWLGGGGLGLLIGLLLQLSLSHLLRRYIPLETSPAWNGSLVLQSMLATGLCLALATLPVLLRARSIPPALILRRNMAERRMPLERRTAAGVLLAVVVGFWILGSWISQSWRLGGYFVLGGLMALCVCAAAAQVVIVALRAGYRLLSEQLPVAVRQGWANVYRPGNQAAMVVMGLGAGIACLFASYLMEGGMADRMLEWSPVKNANLFVGNIGPREFDAFEQFLSKQSGVAAQISPYVSLRIVSVNGVPFAQLPSEVQKPLSGKSWFGTSSDHQPSELRTVEGSWWKPGEDEPRIALSAGTAKWMHVGLGSVLEFSASGRRIRGKVAVLHQSSTSARLRWELTFNARALEGQPVIFNGGLLVDDTRIEELKRRIHAAFPDVVLIDVSYVRQILSGLVDQAVTVFEFLAVCAIVAGAATLGASVTATRARRVNELALFKLLGATPTQVARMQFVEFSILGAASGLLGACCGWILAALLLRHVLAAQARGAVLGAALFATLGAAILVNVVGWLANLRVLSAHPLQVLRED